MSKGPISVERTIDSGLVCPGCGALLPSEAKFCPFDGCELVADSGQSGFYDSLVGYIVDERYEVLQLLGEGGMGCVYRVRHRVLGRLFALKALRMELARDAVTAERFVQEARAAAAISHPNIVSINDFGMLETGQPYFVMELLEGRTLSSLLLERGSLVPADAVAIARQVASALGAAHDAGVIHRDLKPDNIVLTAPDWSLSQLKVLDFGLAMVHGNGRLTRDGVVFGTPQYMSPEQASGESLDARVDIYALGVLLYEMLTGQVPFLSDSHIGVLTKQVYAEPVPPSFVNQSLLAYPQLEELVLRCLSKDRRERYASMHEVGRALDAVSSLWERKGNSDSIRPRLPSARPPMDSRIRRRRRRRRAIAYTAVGAIALAAALLLLYRYLTSASSPSQKSVGPASSSNLEGASSAALAEVPSSGPLMNSAGTGAAAARRDNRARRSETAPASTPLSRDPGQISIKSETAGRPGGRPGDGASLSRSRAAKPAASANSNRQPQLGSSEISDPWAQ